MKMVNMLFNENAKDALINGVNLIADAVQTTYGPNGRNVIIKGNSGIYITKDGATVARYVESDNPFVSTGIELIKGIAQKTAGDVGDGTTTATILARNLIETLKDVKENPITVSRILDEEVKKVISYLETEKKEVSSLEDLVKVATLSTNNDEKLGRLVAETFYKVTKDGEINIEDSQDIADSVVFSQGIKLETGYNSPFFINNQIKNTCELDNVLVAIFRSPLKEVKEVMSVCDQAIKEKKSLLIMAPKIDATIIRTLIINKDNGNLHSCCVVTPGFGVYREATLTDIETILFDEQSPNTIYCDKAIIGKNVSYLIKDTIKKTDKYTETVDQLKEIIKANTLSDFERDFAKKRLANYISGVATIYVGGYSKVEIQEKKDRLEDAIGAVKAAMNEGVLPGGGFALYQAGIKLGSELLFLNKILNKPVKLLAESAGEIFGGTDLPFWTGKDYKNNRWGDMYDMGIIDPFLVTKTALENAISVASLILTNGCAIVTL